MSPVTFGAVHTVFEPASANEGLHHRELLPGSKIVHTEAYDPGTVGDSYPGNDAIVTVTFTEDGGVTTVTTLIDFGSKEARDAAVSTGMTDGMEQSYQLLDRLLDEEPRA